MPAKGEPALHGSEGAHSPTVEEYLEAIRTMGAGGEPMIGARLAEALGVSPPSVTEMLKRLVEKGLIEMNERKEIRLTASGEEVATVMVRRHRLAERLLTDILGLDWGTVHEEACRFEHAISQRVEERLVKLLGDPLTCPHGNPIPGREPVVAEGDRCTLDRVAAGSRVVVERIAERAERDPELLDYIGHQGILPGVHLEVQGVAPYQGPLTLLIEGKTIAIGPLVASLVWVSAEGAPAA